MQSVFHDLRYGLRQLVKSPGFALTAVVSLALGVGATTAVFSVIYAALMNPYPYRAADRIVRLTLRNKEGLVGWANLNGPLIRQVQQVRAVESVLAMEYHAFTLTGHDLPANVDDIDLISTGFADLGIKTVLGRGLVPADSIDGQEPQPVVVLSYKFWQREFLASPDVVGKTLELDRKKYTIVGVAGPRFTWYSADVYRPLKLEANPALLDIIDVYLRPGVTFRAADAALEPLIHQFAKDYPKRFPEHFQVQVEGLNEWVTRSISGTLYLLFGAVGLLLAIGCGNVSILLLARGTARQHELAVRTAIGANRRRLARQLLTEALMLSAAGVGLGVAASYGILAAVKAVLPPYAFAPEVVVEINLPVLFFSGGVALATGVLFGLWPALRLSRAEISGMMQSNARRVAGSVEGRRTHGALIAGQIALTLLLLAGAGSAMEGFLRMVHTPLGYDPHNVLSLQILLHENSYTTWAARATYFEQLRAKVAELPGVTMTAISSNATPPHNGWHMPFEIAGKFAAEQRRASVNMVNEGYFGLLRIPLAEGRIWSDTETHSGAHVAVINRTLARRYFSNGGAVGHSLKLPNIEDTPPLFLAAPNIMKEWLEIVGVVEDARNDGLSDPITPAVYVPYTLSMVKNTQILVRAAASPLALVNGMRAQLAAVNPEQQTSSLINDLDAWITNQPEWQQEHLAAWVFGIFAGLALALAAVGLYSVVSYTVAQRTNEFGIRMALGAGRGHVLRIVFRSTLVSVAGGMAAGLAMTVAMNKMLGQWVKGSARDPMILLAGAVVLSLVAGLACAIPGWQASRVDPMAALRCE